MTLAIVAALPVDSRFVPSCLENIIDKRVCRIALNTLEKVVNWVCSWIYFPYHNLYRAKMERVHIFSDGMARLFDSTKQGIATIDRNENPESIALHGRNVHFIPNPLIKTVFARHAFTDYVVIKDDSRRAGWYEIIEQEISRLGNPKPMEKKWFVNTNQIHLFAEGDGKEAYLVEQPRTAI